RSTEEVMRTLRRIRDLDVRVVIDDFGTGFSSLSYLRQLPVNRLKIDRSFIDDMLVSSGSSAIVEGVITMAHRLGMLVVAEGVETEEQRRELVRRNCDLLQGFLFSPALPLPDLEAYWRSHG
ncbi:MAG: EAL domain-containing protein, partial [Pseudomonadota bacterium]